METSGHGAIKENYFLDDGATTAYNGIDWIDWLKIKPLAFLWRRKIRTEELRHRINADNLGKEGRPSSRHLKNFMEQPGGLELPNEEGVLR